eukprot:11656051-Ditylum_brightwellii.AAC.1
MEPTLREWLVPQTSAFALPVLQGVHHGNTCRADRRHSRIFPTTAKMLTSSSAYVATSAALDLIEAIKTHIRQHHFLASATPKYSVKPDIQPIPPVPQGQPLQPPPHVSKKYTNCTKLSCATGATDTSPLHVSNNSTKWTYSSPTSEGATDKQTPCHTSKAA